MYPVTTPRDSSLRTRDWTADTDSPAVAARWASVARPSATSSRASIRSMSSSGSLMAALTIAAGVERMSKRVETWLLRARFAAALSRDVRRRGACLHHPGRRQRRGEPRHWADGSARRAGHRRASRRDPRRQPCANSPTSPTSSRRSACTRWASTTCAKRASPVPGGVHRVPARSTRIELDRNPFRVFTSMLATADARFFDAELRGRVERFLAERQLFDPALIAEATPHRRRRWRGPERADDFVAARGGRVRAVPRADRPRLVRRAVRGLRGRRRHRGRARPPTSTTSRRGSSTSTSCTGG